MLQKQNERKNFVLTVIGGKLRVFKVESFTKCLATFNPKSGEWQYESKIELSLRDIISTQVSKKVVDDTFLQEKEKIDAINETRAVNRKEPLEFKRFLVLLNLLDANKGNKFLQTSSKQTLAEAIEEYNETIEECVSILENRTYVLPQKQIPTENQLQNLVSKFKEESKETKTKKVKKGDLISQLT